MQAIIATQLTTPADRSMVVWINGRDLTAAVKWDSLRIQDGGNNVRGTTSLHLEGALANYREIVDQARLQVYDRAADAMVTTSYVRSRLPLRLPAYTAVDVQADHIGSLLDDAFIHADGRPVETLQARVGYLWGRYAGSHLSGDMGLVQSIGSALPTQDFAGMTLRQAIEASLSMASNRADYFVDGLGRLHIFEAEADHAPADVTSDATGTGHRYHITAHRGDIGSADSYPENTLEAVAQAATKGADRIELDVQLSADSTFYLMHDATVDRTTDGTGALSALSDAQVDALQVDGGFGYDAGRHGTALNVPTLESVVTALAAYPGLINFDLKDSSNLAHIALAEFIVDQWDPERAIINCKTRPGAAGVKEVHARIRTMAQSVVSSTPQDELHIDDWLALRTEVDEYTDTTRREPGRVEVYVDTSEFGLDETAWLQDAFAFGCRAFMSNDLDAALVARDALLAGTPEIAPQDLSVDYESNAYANRVYVQGATPAGSGFFQNDAAIAAASGVVRTAVLQAADCETPAMAQSLASMYLGRVKSGRPRGSFTTAAQDGWRAGQNLLVSSSDLELDAVRFRIARVTTRVIRPGSALRRSYTVEFGGSRAGSAAVGISSSGSEQLVSGNLGGTSNTYVTGDGIRVTDGQAVRVEVGRLVDAGIDPETGEPAGEFGLRVVSDDGSTVIIDGTSNMFKIAATGTHNVALAAGPNVSGTDSVTLTGLGALSTTPAHLTFLATGNVTSANQHLGFLQTTFGQKWVAGSSGGTPNQSRQLADHVADAHTTLNGSSQCVHRVSGKNDGGTSVTFYARYYILQETAL